MYVILYFSRARVNYIGLLLQLGRSGRRRGFATRLCPICAVTVIFCACGAGGREGDYVVPRWRARLREPRRRCCLTAIGGVGDYFKSRAHDSRYPLLAANRPEAYLFTVASHVLY